MASVSNPFRESPLSQPEPTKTWRNGRCRVSNPFRESPLSQRRDLDVYGESLLEVFPTPFGNRLSLNDNNTVVILSGCLSFQPLSGIASLSTAGGKMNRINPTLFPTPFGNRLSLNIHTRRRLEQEKKVSNPFRESPLSQRDQYQGA